MKIHHFIFILFLSLFSISYTQSPAITTSLPIKKVIIWGHKLHSHTHSYIHWAFERTFKHLGYDTYWFDNKDDITDFDFTHSLFITEGQVDQEIPVREDCFYILHNCKRDKYQHLYDRNHAILLQVYTHDCLQNNVAQVDDFIYANLEQKIIYMPWATDLLPEEIEKNKQKIVTEKKNEFVYVGSVWGGTFGNIDQVNRYKIAAKENNVAYNHAKNCSMETNIEMVRNAYMAPSLQGEWQVQKGYIPCRIFKNISYGAFGITNSETVYNLFHKKIVYNSDEYQLFYDAQEKLDQLNIQELLDLMDFVKEKHTYINRIEHLLSFFETVYNNQQ